MEFTDVQLARFHSQLDGRKSQLLKLSSHHKHEALDELSLETTDEISHIRTHNADLGTNEFDQDLDLQLAGDEIREIQDIEDALTRLSQGSFGFCLNCGREIPLSRLEALPAARYCGPCEFRLEHRQREHLHESRV